MQTQLLTEHDTARAAEILRAGGLCAIPTETVYGLAAHALDEAAVTRIFEAKGRAQDNPLIVHIADMDALPRLAAEIPPKALRLAQAFWPGPLTMIFKKTPLVPDAVTCGMDTVAVRIPSHPIARCIIEEAGIPLAAPSANLSGSPSPTTAAHCIADLSGRVEAVLDGGECAVGVESTVLLMACEPPRLLRPGYVTVEDIEAVIGDITVDAAITQPLKAGERPASPGMKYKHYAPCAKVTLIDASAESYAAFVNARAVDGVFALCFEEDMNRLTVPAVPYGRAQDDASQAAELFGALRRLDDLGAVTVYARMPHQAGVGLAVYNRLLRAAGFDVIKP